MTTNKRRMLSPNFKFQVVMETIQNQQKQIDCLFGKFKFILFSNVLTKRISGANSSQHSDTDNALKAYSKLKRYLKRKNIPLGEVIVHQDQDTVFTGYEYAGKLIGAGITLSFTERGFKDNQMMESCVGHFKEEYKSVLQRRILRGLKSF